MSTSSRENRFIASIGKPRRSPPGDVQGSFFTGQGGRTVLPPLSSAFPTSRFPGLLFSCAVFLQRTQYAIRIQCPTHIPLHTHNLGRLQAGMTLTLKHSMALGHPEAHVCPFTTISRTVLH
jgi:hypothetical protein